MSAGARRDPNPRRGASDPHRRHHVWCISIREVSLSEQDPRLHRLLFLSDGVYAIALTLLAVELVLPGTAADLHGTERPPG
jgi:hypothetical protein